jgi:hypothetical protein
LKGRSLWQIPILKSCSWSWKKLLRLRDIAKTFIHYQIGDGSQIFLWYDHWHPAGYLLDTYGFRVVYDSGFPKEAKMSSTCLRRIGFGQVQDPRIWWLYKVNSLRLLLGIRINLFGILVGVPIHVPKFGII